jgi:hypothetical protein
MSGCRIVVRFGYIDHFNELWARITGNPPRILTWVKGVQFMHFTDTMKRHPDTGGIAL